MKRLVRSFVVAVFSHAIQYCLNYLNIVSAGFGGGLHMNKPLVYSSCAISAAASITGTLGHTAPGPLWVICMHKIEHL